MIRTDIEPLIGMVSGATVLHGYSHTILGALLIALISVMLTPRIARPLLTRWNWEVHHYGLDWLTQATVIPPSALWSGALWGTFSHIALDATMHADMRPLAPFSNANPWMGLLEHDAVYAYCALAIVIGSVAWLLRRWWEHRHSLPDSSHAEN